MPTCSVASVASTQILRNAPSLAHRPKTLKTKRRSPRARSEAGIPPARHAAEVRARELIVAMVAERTLRPVLAPAPAAEELAGRALPGCVPRGADARQVAQREVLGGHCSARSEARRLRTFAGTSTKCHPRPAQELDSSIR
mmetsp:Transcript_99345/g.276470  ORF Transcript_99345/g.276470 Transcript_99345/m.276470 type:complete len:141 (-) Transcript_99345:161-583(-)